jgi:hypothetical protein
MREAGLSGAVLYFEGGVEAMEKFAADGAPSLRAA